MANRDLTEKSWSFEKMRKVISARVSFGAAGAPTLDGPNSKGVLDITRNSTGNYTVRFGTSVNSVNQFDYYVKLLALEWLPDVSFITGASPAAVGQPASYRSDLQTGANTSMAPPVQSALATSGAGGTGLSAGTQYFYVVTAVDQNGTETLVSNERNVTTGGGGTNSNTVTWAVVPGAVKYRVYRGTSAGAESVVYEVAGGASVTYLDTGAASGASAVSPVVQARPPVAQAALTIQTLNGSGVATDPASGEAVFLQFDFGDSSSP